MIASSLFSGMAVSAQEKQPSIERIEISGSRYTLMEETSAVNNHLSRDAIEKMPHIADDVFRLMPTIPGVSAGDFSANFFVRGGEADEVLVMLDGQQLYRPFHMKSFNGAFSIIDTENVGRMDFSSGGYSAKYGNKMSGVLNIQSLTPTEERQYSLGVSFINARAGAQGEFAEGRGSWLVSARRGYLDWILEMVEDESSKFEPIYGDIYGKVTYLINDEHELTASLLYAYDDEILDDKFKEWDGVQEYDVKEKIEGEYASSYLWLNLNSDWSDEVSSQTILSIGKVEEDRHGGQYDPYEVWLTLNDEKHVDFLELKQDWQWTISNDWLVQGGFHLKQLDAEYDYKMEVWYLNNYAHKDDYLFRKSDISAEGNDIGVYVNTKYRLSDKWLTEFGVRWDEQDYVGFTDDQVSPRASIAYVFSDDTQIRMSWGHYYQPEDILGLQVADGVTDFAKAQKSEHRIIGLDNRVSDDTSLRVELYQKKITDIRPRYENAFDMYAFFPEGQADRYLVAPTSADIIGAEFSVNQRYSDRLSWAASYTWSEATDEISGKDYPRSWDQNHAINLSVNYQFDNEWHISAALVYHSGWPITSEYGTSEKQPDGSYKLIKHLGERNQDQLADYHRIDMRASKTYALTNSQLTVFFEVSNLLNVDNECCVDESKYHIDKQGKVYVHQVKGHWLPIIPSFGVKWIF